MERVPLPVDEVLDYWFGNCLSDPTELDSAFRRWFLSGGAQDHEIQMRFAAFIKPVAAMPLEEFTAPLPTLTAVLILDQFPRHVFRGQAEAFAFDGKSLKLLDKALQNQWDKQLHPLHASFLYMPLQHAEDLHRQEQGVRLYNELADSAEPPYKGFIEGNLDYARQHLELVRRFGRFPHRNHALGRASTAEEAAFLAEDSRSFGQ